MKRKIKKENVYVYRTNGNVEKLFVECPEVGTLNQLNQVGIFNHCGVRVAIDDYDEWYEDIAIYWTTEVAAIYADGKCVWNNEFYVHNRVH